MEATSIGDCEAACSRFLQRRPAPYPAAISIVSAGLVQAARFCRRDALLLFASLLFFLLAFAFLLFLRGLLALALRALPGLLSFGAGGLPVRILLMRLPLTSLGFIRLGAGIQIVLTRVALSPQE